MKQTIISIVIAALIFIGSIWFWISNYIEISRTDKSNERDKNHNTRDTRS